MLRKEIKKQLISFDGKRESEAIVKALQEREDYKKAKIILAFLPLKTEPDISTLIQDTRVALPYIEGKDMNFSFSKKLSKSSLGFLEPEHKSIKYEKALMLVPLLAYDSEGYRLGRGGGFYDRYIQENKSKLYTLGIAFSISKVEHLPLEEFDQKLDEILVL